MTIKELDLFVIELSECTGNSQSWYLKKLGSLKGAKAFTKQSIIIFHLRFLGNLLESVSAYSIQLH